MAGQWGGSSTPMVVAAKYAPVELDEPRKVAELSTSNYHY
jgi:hypothetical protein